MGASTGPGPSDAVLRTPRQSCGYAALLDSFLPFRVPGPPGGRDMEESELPRRIGIGLTCTLVVMAGLWFIGAGSRRVTVTLTVGSTTRTVQTAAPTVARLLAEEKVDLRPLDQVRPPP